MKESKPKENISFIDNNTDIYESAMVKGISACEKHMPWAVQACVEVCACDRRPNFTMTALFLFVAQALVHHLSKIIS